MLKEFKEFAMKGNVIDLAVGIIIGAAFGKIVSSLVSDIIMPIIGAFGKFDFTGLSIVVRNSTITYGNFIQAVVDFLIVSFSIFIVVRQLNRFKRQTPPPPEAKSAEVEILEQIRDALQK